MLKLSWKVSRCVLSSSGVRFCFSTICFSVSSIPLSVCSSRDSTSFRSSLSSVRGVLMRFTLGEKKPTSGFIRV